MKTLEELSRERLSLLAEWNEMAEQLEVIKASEMELRKRVFPLFFPNPKEGANNEALPAGFKLCGTYKLNRTLDIAVLENIKDKLREAMCNPDTLIKYKPELVIAQYRELTEEQKNIFDTALTITPGAPSLEIKAPPKKKGAA